MSNSYYPSALEQLIEQFAKLPGVGRKSAQRLAFYVLTMTDDQAKEFASSIQIAKSSITRCPICKNITDNNGPCIICSDSHRDSSIICVVSEPKDVIAMENSKEYNGVYHVLHGVISPMNHVSPDDIELKSLIQRIDNENIQEVIIATNPDTEGEATAMYISRLLHTFNVKVTRLAYGVPIGSHLEYADGITLARAIEGRREM